MQKWKVYISSTFKDLHEIRATLINLFQNELKKGFELCEIMERMFDNGTYTPFIEDCVKAVESSDIYIIILGNEIGSFPPTNNLRTYTEIELDTAIKLKKRIFCLRLEIFNVKKENGNKHHEILTKFSGFPTHKFRDEITLENILFRCLIQFTSEQPIKQNNPYQGLNAFRVADGDYFFGRNEEIENCIKKIIVSKTNANISIIGNSGIGKTSFAQAGVLYKLIQRPEFENFKIIIVTPGNEPFTNLQYKSGFKNENDLAIFDNTILFLNQFEEVITQCNTPESIKEREQLFELLDILSSSTTIKCHVISTYRSDFFSPLANFDFIKNTTSVPLSSLDYSFNVRKWEASITEIITQPALKHGVEIEEVLVKRLLEEIKELDGSLPILQFTLEKIWTSETISDRIITASEYEKISDSKGITGIIETHADKVIGEIIQGDEKRERIVKSILVNLVEVNNSQLDVKKTVKKDDLFIQLSVYPDYTVNDIFEKLVGNEGRLLVVSKAKDNSINVDIIHEVLIRKWEKLRIWINERREALEYQKDILKDIKGFEKGEQKLHSGSDLRTAEKWIKNNPDLMNNLITQFIEQSIKRRTKNRVISIGVILVLFLLGCGLFKPYQIYQLRAIQSIQYQIEAYGNEIDSVKTLTIDNTNYQLLKGKLNYFGRLDSVIISISAIDNLSILELENSTSIKYVGVASNTDITSLAGIEKLTDLQQLKIYENNNLTSLAGIEKLTTLKQLTISANDKLTSLAGVEKLTALKQLTISGNYNLTDLAGIEKLPVLQQLTIENTDKLTSLSGVEKLTALKQLTISGNYNLTDLAGIEKLPVLQQLTISKYFNLTSLVEIEKLTALQQLTISNNYNLISLAGIEKLTALQQLTISENRNLTSLAGIEKLTALKQLTISEISYLASLAGIEKLTALQQLTISRIPSLAGIEKLTALQQLTISNNYNLISLAGIEKLTALQQLTISESDNLTSLAGIEKLPALQQLTISKNSNFTSLVEIEKLTALQQLTISEINNLTSLAGIEKLTSLQQLIISENRNLTSLAGIENLTALQQLAISEIYNLTSLAGIEKLIVLRYLRIKSEGSIKTSDINIIYQLNNLKQLIIPSTTNLDYEQLSKGNPGVKLIRENY